MTKVKIVGENLIGEELPVYLRYPGQCNVQSAYVELDCETGELGASYNAEIGNAVPFSVWYGHDQRWGIDPCISGDRLCGLLEDIVELAQIVVDGHESIWNGNNHVAKFSEKASEAIDEIGTICGSLEADVEVIDRWDDYFASDMWHDINNALDEENDVLKSIGNFSGLDAALKKHSGIDYVVLDDEEGLKECVLSTIENDYLHYIKTGEEAIEYLMKIPEWIRDEERVKNAFFEWVDHNAER